MSTEIITRDGNLYMPTMSIAQAVDRRAAMVDFVRRLMVDGVDYGTIPGATKPSLQKPGAEKLCTLFGLTPTFHLEEADRDWIGADHGGEPLFHMHYKCKLWRDGVLMGEGEGSCNSWETKYRYRQAERACPQCGRPAIIKGKAEYGGGWLCFAKKGGCGAKFAAGDPAIEQQVTGRVINPDPADLVNTIAKMAQKRALVAATLVAVNASEFFTQDLEDFATEHQPAPPAPHHDLNALAARVKALREAERAHIAPPPSFTWKPSAGADPLLAEIAASRARIIGALGAAWPESTPDEALIAAAHAAREAEYAAIEEATKE